MLLTKSPVVALDRQRDAVIGHAGCTAGKSPQSLMTLLAQQRTRSAIRKCRNCLPAVLNPSTRSTAQVARTRYTDSQIQRNPLNTETVQTVYMSTILLGRSQQHKIATFDLGMINKTSILATLDQQSQHRGLYCTVPAIVGVQYMHMKPHIHTSHC